MSVPRLEDHVLVRGHGLLAADAPILIYACIAYDMKLEGTFPVTVDVSDADVRTGCFRFITSPRRGDRLCFSLQKRRRAMKGSAVARHLGEPIDRNRDRIPRGACDFGFQRHTV